MSQVAVTLRRIVLHELQNQVRRKRVERRPTDAHRALRNLLVQYDMARVRLVERRQPRQHLEDEYAERVPVHTFIVSLVPDYLPSRAPNRQSRVSLHANRTNLWCKVVWGSAQCPRCRCAGLGETEVCYLDVPVPVEENVFRLQVPVDDFKFVEVVQRKSNFGSVELGNGVGKALRGRLSIPIASSKSE